MCEELMEQIDMWSMVLLMLLRGVWRWVSILVGDHIFFRTCLFGSIVVLTAGIIWQSKPLFSRPGT